MNKLKEIDGKYYQEGKVFIIPTKREYSQFDPELKDQYTIVRHNLKELYITNLPWSKKYSSEVHLYITSNEGIKKGDYYLNILSKEINVSTIDVDKNTKGSHFLKIIATTDNSIFPNCDGKCAKKECICLFPQPSKQFIQKYIEEYNKGNVIERVLVEYNWMHITKKYPKVDSHNCITIKPIKDSWTREEVEKLCRIAMQYGHDENTSGKYIHQIDDNKWIEENLF